MTLYTFGYAGQSLGELTKHVTTLNGVIVDVRYAPFSRATPEWSMHGLRERYRGRYLWLKAFGNLNYKGGPIQIADYAAGYLQLQQVVNGGHEPILLCVCPKVADCHRKIVAARLAHDLGSSVIHLGQPAKKPRQQGLFM